jgi:hypothetical protein
MYPLIPISALNRCDYDNSILSSDTLLGVFLGVYFKKSLFKSALFKAYRMKYC